MIKKLRWRFITAAMLAFFFVIALIAGLVMCSTIMLSPMMLTAL